MEYFVYMTNDCNLMCEYCSVLLDCEKNKLPIKPTYTYENLIKFIKRTQEQTNDDEISIYFFGGEPSLEYDDIEALINIAKKQLSTYSLKFVLHTNGLRLDILPENILNDLKLLELEGKIFYDARNNTYKTFPSNFFITKVTSVKDNEFYFKINTKEYNLPNKNSLKKKDTIILEKVHNRFKFIKAIQNIEQEKSNDYDRIVDLFDAYNKSYSLHALAKIIKTNDLTTLQNTLTSLEEQGKVYFNEDENKYQPFPKQYKIVTIETGKKGFYYIRNKDSIYPLKDEETIGILPFDKVILEKNNDGFNIVKVLKRNNPNIICEVTEKGIRVVGNNNIKIRCNEKNFKDLKLPVGTRILVKIGTKETNKVYDVSFIEVTGHKNDLTSELEAIACNNGFITRYTKEELESRVEVLYEQYSNTINIEGLATLDIAKKQIVPAVMKYQRKLANGVAELKTVGVDSSVQEKLLEDITANLKDLFAAINKLEADIPEAQALESEAQARYYHDTIFTDMSAVREPADKLEMLVAKEDWPMPSYGDLIFEV